MKKYEQIRKKLIKRKENLEQRLDNIDQDILHTDTPPDPDSEEQALERQNDEVLDTLGGLVRSELEEINMALTRIEQGEYGTCSVCGKAIPIERLKAVPHADRCVVCADLEVEE